MKYLVYALFITLLFACNKQDPEEAGASVVLCESSEFQLTIEANGVTMTTDSTWLLYFEDPTTVEITEDFAAILKWRYPGYPEWDGANSLTFIYNTLNLESSKTYPAREVLGVLEFDGSTGEMFQGLGDESLTVTVDEFNAESGYICGSLEGRALFTDNSPVDVTGNFKGVLMPQ